MYDEEHYRRDPCSFRIVTWSELQRTDLIMNAQGSQVDMMRAEISFYADMFNKYEHTHAHLQRATAETDITQNDGYVLQEMRASLP